MEIKETPEAVFSAFFHIYPEFENQWSYFHQRMIRDYSSFSIIHFPYLGSNKLTFLWYEVYMSKPIRHARTCSLYLPSYSEYQTIESGVVCKESSHLIFQFLEDINILWTVFCSSRMKNSIPYNILMHYLIFKWWVKTISSLL